jgi:DNA invertase Pin-like site-specific DNA recombinase
MQIDTNSPMGMALFTILGALSQLERELIRERVRAGLATAKLRGKQIGRKKLRDSILIRSLLKNSLSFRKIAVIAKCSHGSISAEKRDMLREEAERQAKIEEQMARLLPAPEERDVGPSGPPA